MRVESENNTLESSGIGETHAGTIKASAAAFRILSNDLYSYKVKAVIREVSCNAYDANVMAGISETPIEVHLPTSLNPNFIVRDEGPGMSQADIFAHGMGYFSTTKENEDNQIGGFGLGFKSPFAYTDSFSVVSWHGGRRTTYAMYLDEDQCPRVTVLEDIESPGSSGLEVRVPVKSGDFVEFQREAETLFPYLPVKPAVNLPMDLESQYFLETEHYGIQKAHRTPQIVMGGVAYPIDLQAWQFDVPLPKDLAEIWGQFRHRTALDIFQPINAIAIAPNREGLSYTKRTKATLRELIITTLQRINADLAVELATKTTPWEQRKFLRYVEASITTKITEVFGADIAAFYFRSAHPSINMWAYKDKCRTSITRLTCCPVNNFQSLSHLSSNANFRLVRTDLTPGQMSGALRAYTNRNVVASSELLFIHAEDNIWDLHVKPFIDGVPITTWDEFVAENLTRRSAPQKSYSSAERAKSTPRKYWSFTNDCGMQEHGRDFWEEQIKAGAPVIYAWANKFYLDPECTLRCINGDSPIDDLKQKLDTFRAIASHFSNSGIGRVFAIPRDQVKKYPNHVPLTTKLRAALDDLTQSEDFQIAAYNWSLLRPDTAIETFGSETHPPHVLEAFKEVSSGMSPACRAALSEIKPSDSPGNQLALIWSESLTKMNAVALLVSSQVILDYDRNFLQHEETTYLEYIITASYFMYPLLFNLPHHFYPRNDNGLNDYIVLANLVRSATHNLSSLVSSL